MSNKFVLVGWLLSLGLVLSGCGTSPPNNYYVLTPHEFPAANGETPALGVGPIEVPEYLKRRSMVYQREGNTLKVASMDMWGEPLQDGIQRVLVLNLSGLLNTQDVSFFPWHPGRAPDFGVKINVLQMDANEHEATLKAEWLVYRSTKGEPINRRISQLVTPLSSDSPKQVAAAYSDLLFQLSEIIAAAIPKNRAEANSTATP
jgi:hypothetical protein